MTPVVLILLAVVWAVYLFTWFRSRSERRGSNSITTFSRHLSVLERTSPARQGFATVPLRSLPDREPEVVGFGFGAPARRAPRMSLDEARRRRRTVLLTLAGVSVGSLLFVPFLGTVAVAVNVLADLAFVGYVALLVRSQKLAAERREKVRYLPVAPHESSLALQRSAN